MGEWEKGKRDHWVTEEAGWFTVAQATGSTLTHGHFLRSYQPAQEHETEFSASQYLQPFCRPLTTLCFF
jgi:hypothetical protein